MVTKQQATEATHGDIFHYVGVTQCRKEIGPRGAVKIHTINCRVSGKCQTWKTRPNNFRLPVKYGLYESGSINEWNAEDWHKASECPLIGLIEKAIDNSQPAGL